MVFLKEEDRAVFVNQQRDAATIIIKTELLPVFPEQALPLSDSSKFFKVGGELGWTGYPSVAQPHLCFFSGRVSCFLESDDCYLIDGVAINGVSGGPVFIEKAGEQVQLVGIISAYVSNRSGNTPGLLRAQHITPLADTEKWPRLSEQHSPILKWTACGLPTVQSCPRRRSALATNRPTRWATRGAPAGSSYAASFNGGRPARYASSGVSRSTLECGRQALYQAR